MSDLTYTCFINGIAHETRQKWAIQCAKNIDAQNFGFDKKMVCFDEFNEHKVSDETKQELKNMGWEVLVLNLHSRIRTLKHVLDKEENDIFCYVEDDVLVQLPEKNDTDIVFEDFKNERRCGMISMSVGGGGYDWPNNNWGDLQFINENNVLKNKKYEFFLRDEKHKTPYFFEFPVVFIKTFIFQTCVEASLNHFRGQQIETAFTSAWFFKAFDQDYYKCSVVKPDSKAILEKNMKDVDKIVFLEFLDSGQGNNLWGGNNYA